MEIQRSNECDWGWHFDATTATTITTTAATATATATATTTKYGQCNCEATINAANPTAIHAPSANARPTGPYGSPHHGRSAANDATSNVKSFEHRAKYGACHE